MRDVQRSPDDGPTSTTFESFFRAEYRPIVMVATAVCGSFTAGEDITQEAMFRASRTWDDIASLDRPGAWVRRVAINLALNRRRDNRRRDELLEQLAGSAESSAPTDHEDDARLWAAMASLSDDQRTVLALVEVDGYEPHELAAVLDCRPGAVRVRLHRARTALRDAYERTGAE